MRGQQIASTICYVLPYLLLPCVALSTGLGWPKGCPPSSCGPLQNIKYPFRLQNDPANCGDPNYELLCVDNKTILDFHQGKYYVNEISYGNRTIQITDVNLPNGSCHLPLRSLSFTVISEDHRYTLSSWIWVSFVNCTRRIQNHNYLPISCLSRSNVFIYAVSNELAYELQYLEPSCRFQAMFPMSDASVPRSQEDIFRLLQMGISLSWVEGEDISSSNIVHVCLREASRMFSDHIKSSNFLSQVSSLVKGEMHFLACLEDYTPLGSSYRKTFRIAVALMVLVEIVQLLIVLAIMGRFIIAPITICMYLAHRFHRIKVSVDIVEKFLQNQQSLTPTRYSYTDLIAMTGHFREKLGQGGFGSVFKGKLPGDYLVAVKMLGNSKCNGEEFMNEVSTIGRIHHVNVVQLVGFCSEGTNRALVYEYLPNGSLDKYIFSSNPASRPFTLEKLNEIALGVARGIDYLHRGCDMRILHFDIKPHNILLDHNFTPKVSDFGLAKLYPKDYSHVSFGAARGTIGYMAPELISRNFGVISYKSDVYSFGMLLMEMAGGRRNADLQQENSSQYYYPSWIYDQLAQEEEHMFDNTIEIGEVEKKLSKVGLCCIQMRPSDRPSMSQAVEMLEADADTLQLPPKPCLSSENPRVVRKSCLSFCPTELSMISEQEPFNC